MAQPNKNPKDQPSESQQQPNRSQGDEISDADLDAVAGGARRVTDGPIKLPPITTGPTIPVPDKPKTTPA